MHFHFSEHIKADLIQHGRLHCHLLGEGYHWRNSAWIQKKRQAQDCMNGYVKVWTALTFYQEVHSTADRTTINDAANPRIKDG